MDLSMLSEMVPGHIIRDTSLTYEVKEKTFWNVNQLRNELSQLVYRLQADFYQPGVGSLQAALYAMDAFLHAQQGRGKLAAKLLDDAAGAASTAAKFYRSAKSKY